MEEFRINMIQISVHLPSGNGDASDAQVVVAQWRLPEQVVVPIASGAQLVKVDKGFAELISLGLVAETPWRVFGAQATGCAPVSAAFAAGHDVVRPGGPIADVSDEEVVDSIRLLAECEGIFGETAGGVTLGVLRKLLAGGQLDPEAETVIINSGDGLKTLDAVASAVRIPAPIKPTLEAFQEAVP